MANPIKKRYVLIFFVTAFITAALTLLLVNIFEKKQEANLYPSVFKPVGDYETDPKVWGENFPFEYDSYKKTETNEGPTYYGGSDNYQKLEKYPNLIRLFAGYPFSKDYREERGHYWAITDVKQSLRVNEKTANTCISCKSSQVLEDVEKMGPENFYKAMFKDVAAHYDKSIGCLDCHDPKTMELRVKRPAFIEAMQRRGIDVTKASRQEMRSYVCGQCHVEYYFKGEGKYLTFPWDKGFNVDSIEAYYDEYNFTDWNHETSGAPMIKMQHPEFETWNTGIHARSGVSCVDCHMPYERAGSVKVTNHWIKSPLRNINNACQTCHKWNEQELIARVKAIQDRTYETMYKTELAILDAIDAIKKAKDAGANDEQLANARKLHRRAQLRWDFIAAENSMGFHSPQETLKTLSNAIDYARQSQLEAERWLRNITMK
ncbi:MAG: ammonia-forming cytochrome c nitrite reductase subunit c552 [Chlorobi bacterium]|nr:ammonia-forming cytochrome c nitrite reductase subunit c552 [Chlorobiota bacterium]MCI0714760.1 ammonia-forming cytochrome c nitrite reductase subunit c552 [Chlorobiota bacterium]